MKIKILIIIAVFAFSAMVLTSCGCENKTEKMTSPPAVDTESGEIMLPRETVAESTAPSSNDKESNTKFYSSDKKSSKDSKSSSNKTLKSDTESSVKKSSKSDTGSSNKKSGKSPKSSSSAKSPTENITADKDENELPFVPIE